ncbi:MAG: type I restriction-modification system subunit M N-terminal domain-containing protein [Coleofasciculus chthonoplastes F3-SA18-01]|uniref:N-6 DNA methylase n=1 Tax=Coleofasciculus chthonoplastes TaxID=64178 RepID=UPI0032FAC52D
MAEKNGKKAQRNGNGGKSLENWIWDAACSIRGAQEAAKYKDFILPLIFTKRLCDVFDDELDRIAQKVGSRAKAFKLVAMDQKLVRFYLPLQPENPDDPVWSVIRKLSDKIGETLTGYLRDIAQANPLLDGIINRVDFNATTHGQRDLDDDRLSNLIEKISEKRLGLKDVEPDLIGRSYEYLIRKFAEGSGRSAGEFYTPKEVGMIMAKIMQPEPGMAIYDPCCGSAGLLVKCQLVLEESQGEEKYAPLQFCIDIVIARTKSTISSHFLSRFFNSPVGKSQALSAKHGLAQQHLNVGAVKNVIVPKPPTLEEQNEVVRILEEVDRKIRICQAKKTLIQDLFRTLLNQLMTAKIRVDDLDLSALNLELQGGKQDAQV